MPIDTATKRYSAINISSPWRGVLPLPDGVIDAGDRQIVPFFYSGILAEEAAPAPAPQPAAAVDAGGAGYAPTWRHRKPRRIVFLEQELLEKYEQQRQLEKQLAVQETRAEETRDIRADTKAALSRAMDQLEALKPAIARLEAEIAKYEADRDDEEAMDVILRTIH